MKQRNWEQKRIKKMKTPHSLTSRTFSGMVALFGTPGSAVLPTKYYFLKEPINLPLILWFFLDFGLIPFCGILQVAQVLLTLPYSFSQLGLLSGILLQLFYGFVGSWTAYLISVLYVEYRSRKERENVNFKNHVIQVSDTMLRTRTTTTIDIG